jgi:hypothetical protein
MYYNSISKDPDNYDALVRYFYDMAKSGAKAEGLTFDYTLEQFDEIIDPIPDAIIKFKEAAGKLFEGGSGKKK